MSTEVLCTIVSVAGTVLSALVAWFVSKSTANKEIEKMRLNWEREDSISSETEFSEMVIAVTRYLHSQSEENFLLAIEKVNIVRLKETGRLFYELWTLYKSLEMCQDNKYHLEFAKDCLTKVIEQKREAT